MPTVRISIDAADAESRKKHASELGYDLKTEIVTGHEITLVFSIEKDLSRGKKKAKCRKRS